MTGFFSKLVHTNENEHHKFLIVKKQTKCLNFIMATYVGIGDVGSST